MNLGRERTALLNRRLPGGRDSSLWTWLQGFWLLRLIAAAFQSRI